MCGRCEGEPYRGIRAAFNGDLQRANEFSDRQDWIVLSDRVIVYIGESVLKTEENILYRGCESSISGVSSEDRLALLALSDASGRPAFGRP